MLKSGGTKAEDARRKAHDQFAKGKQRNADALKERERTERAAAEKTSRLRALRLAKEAADLVVAEQEAAAKAAAATGASSRNSAARGKAAAAAKVAASAKAALVPKPEIA
jgi:hypothetical protein